MDGRIFLSGKVDSAEEKIKITKMAWETKGVRSVENAITIKGQSNFKNTAKDIYNYSVKNCSNINNKTKARNYTLETTMEIFIFLVLDDREEKRKS